MDCIENIRLCANIYSECCQGHLGAGHLGAVQELLDSQLKRCILSRKI